MQEQYQKAWAWIKENRKAPFFTVVYVASVALVVKIKNILTDTEHEVMVEIYDEKNEAAHTLVMLPRLCITEYKMFEDVLKVILESALKIG